MLKNKIDKANKIILLYKKAIKQNEFYDLYALEIILSFADIIGLPRSEINMLQNNFKELVSKVTKEYIYQIHRALVHESVLLQEESMSDEARSLFDANNIPIFASFDDREKHTPKQFEIIFSAPVWPSSYGGKAWAQIAAAYGKLINANKTGKIKDIFQILDQIHQLEHNTGSIFSKFQDKMISWISEGLSNKAIPSSLAIIKNKVSPYLKSYIEKIPGSEDISEDEYSKQVGEVELARYYAKLKQNPKAADFKSSNVAKAVASYLISVGKKALFDFVIDYTIVDTKVFSTEFFEFIDEAGLKNEFAVYFEKERNLTEKQQNILKWYM